MGYAVPRRVASRHLDRWGIGDHERSSGADRAESALAADAARSRRRRRRRDEPQVRSEARPGRQLAPQEAPPPLIAHRAIDHPSLALQRLVVPGADAADGPVARWDANDGHVLYGYRAGGYGWVSIPGVAHYRFDAAGDVVASPDGGSDEAIEDAWLRSVLPLVLQARGTQVLHASAVVGAAGAVALCGVSTSGKSTLAAALATTAGTRLVADDALPFDLEDGQAVAHPVPFRLRLREGSRHLARGDEVVEAGPARLAAIALLEPHGGDRPSTLEPVAPADAFGALMPHAYCFALNEGKEQLVRAYSGLAALVPVGRLSYPQRPDRLDDAVSALAELLG